MIELAPTTHARFAPSAAHRWLACPGSLALMKQLEVRLEELRITPEEAAQITRALTAGRQDTLSDRMSEAGGLLGLLYPESSSHAAEGTAAHEVGEHLLRGVTPPEIASNGVEVDVEMLDYARQYAEEVVWFYELAGDGAELLVEQRVDFGRVLGVEGEAGTADAIIVYPNGRRISVHDLKYGRGVVVDPTRNPQAMLYALGVLDRLGDKAANVSEIDLVIHQPRISSDPKIWTTTVFDLLLFAGRVREVIGLVHWLDENGVTMRDLHPSDKACRFCPVKSRCPAYIQQMDAVFEDLTGQPIDNDNRTDAIGDATRLVRLVSDAKLDQLYPALDHMAEFVTSVRAELERRASEGVAFTNCKRVIGRVGNRGWADPEEVEQTMKASRLKATEMYDKKIISVAKAEKALKGKPGIWAKLEPFITRAEGKPTLVPATDPRPAIELPEFEDVSNDIDDLV